MSSGQLTPDDALPLRLMISSVSLDSLPAFKVGWKSEVRTFEIGHQKEPEKPPTGCTPNPSTKPGIFQNDPRNVPRRVCCAGPLFSWASTEQRGRSASKGRLLLCFSEAGIEEVLERSRREQVISEGNLEHQQSSEVMQQPSASGSAAAAAGASLSAAASTFTPSSRQRHGQSNTNDEGGGKAEGSGRNAKNEVIPCRYAVTAGALLRLSCTEVNTQAPL